MPLAKKIIILEKVGLGGAAKLDVGTTAGTVAAGDDSRFNSIIGVGQTWQDVLSSRQFNVTYTNSTQKTISVSASSYDNGSFLTTAYVNGLEIVRIDATTGTTSPLFFIVPPGATYSISGNGGAASGNTLRTWAELR